MIPARSDRPARPSRRAPLARLAQLAPPAALVALVVVATRFAVDREAAPARLWLALVAAGALAAAGWAAGPRARRLLPALAALAAPLVVLLPIESPLTPAVVLAAAATGLVATAAERLRESPAPAAGDLVALAGSAQILVHGGALWTGHVEAPQLATLVLAPVVAGVAAASLGRRRPELGVAAALVAFAAGPGWGLAGAAALAALALAVRLLRPPARFAGVESIAAGALSALPALGGEPAAIVLALAALGALAAAPGTGQAAPAVSRAARSLVAFAALGALLAGAPPWRREAPLAPLLAGAAKRPLGRIEIALGPRTAALAPGSPRLELDARLARVSTLVVDSFLLEGAGLPCGTPVARFALLSAGREVAAATLAVGRGAGEWAALRPDVAARLACREGRPFALWLPRGGRFFGARWRAVLPLGGAFDADRVVVELDRGLPTETRLALVALGAER